MNHMGKDQGEIVFTLSNLWTTGFYKVANFSSENTQYILYKTLRDYLCSISKTTYYFCFTS